MTMEGAREGKKTSEEKMGSSSQKRVRRSCGVPATCLQIPLMKELGFLRPQPFLVPFSRNWKKNEKNFVSNILMASRAAAASHRFHCSPWC